MKLGIVGAGLIVKEFLSIAHKVPQLEILALLTRPESFEQHRKLCDQYDIKLVYTDYEIMLKNADIETIYVALPNHLHFDFSLKALAHDKHVICEKPFTITAAEAEILRDTAIEHHCMIYEAISTVYLQNFDHIKKALADKAIGDVKIVTCNFSKVSSRYEAFKAGQIMPAFDPMMYGGALMDLNCYNVHFVLGLFGMPLRSAHYPNMSNGVDTSGILVLDYGQFKCLCVAAKDSNSASSVDIQGDLGNLHVPSPSSLIDAYVITDIQRQSRLYNNNLYDHRMVNTFMEIAGHIEANDLDHCQLMLEHSLKVVKILEEARGQMMT